MGRYVLSQNPDDLIFWPRQRAAQAVPLDFEVDDIEAEHSRVLALGATLQQDSIGPDGYGWRVYTDP